MKIQQKTLMIHVYTDGPPAPGRTKRKQPQGFWVLCMFIRVHSRPKRRRTSPAYQIRQDLSATIASPVLQPQADENSDMF
jgi:hypothetical protein